MPYRNDQVAIEARRAELERELHDLKPRVNDLAYLKWKQKELETALAELGAPRGPKRDYVKIALISAVIALAMVMSSAIAIHKLGARPRGLQCGRDVCCGLGCGEPEQTTDVGAAMSFPGTLPVVPPKTQTPHMADRSGPPLPAHERGHVVVDYVLGP